MKRNFIFFILLFVLFGCNNNDIFSKKRTVPPKVSYSYPDSTNSNGFKINSSILVSFDTDMDEISLSQDNFYLIDDDDQRINCSIELYGTKSLIMYPSYDTSNSEMLLLPKTNYQLKISKNVMDKTGNSMEFDYSVNFNTSEYMDITSPSIREDLMSIDNNSIKVYFSEPLNPCKIKDSVTNSLIKLIDENGNSVSFNYYYISEDKSILIEPEIELLDNITYILTFEKDSVVDLANNYFVSSQSFNIKNGSEEHDLIEPEIISVSSGVAITIEFSENIDPASVRIDGDDPTIILPEKYNLNPSSECTFNATFTQGTKKLVIVPETFSAYSNFPEFKGQLVITDKVTDLAGNPLIKSPLYFIGQLSIYRSSGLEQIKGSNIIIGSVSIQNVDFLDLEEFDSVEEIHGNLTIRYNNSLKTISTLKNLKKVTGQVEVISNPQLESLEGLASLAYAESILIDDNGSISSLSGLENLKIVNNYIKITDEPSLNNINSLKNIVSESSFLFYNLPSLKTIDTFTNITAVKSLVLENCGFEDLDFLEYVNSVSNDITLNSNDYLKDISGLKNLNEINGSLTISNNSLLESIDCFNQIKLLKNLNILSNDKLNALSGFNNLINVTVSIDINNNPGLVSLGFPLVKSSGRLSITNNVKLSNSLIKSTFLDYITLLYSPTISGNLEDVKL